MEAASLKMPIGPIYDTSSEPMAMPAIMPAWKPNTMALPPRVRRAGEELAST